MDNLLALSFFRNREYLQLCATMIQNGLSTAAINGFKGQFFPFSGPCFLLDWYIKRELAVEAGP